jgi:DNA-binding transcriptional MerR regulator
MAPTLTIGQVARATGVPARTLRYYEAVGVLRRADRSAAGYRQYGERELERIRFVRRARALGLSLHDVRTLAGALDGHAGTRVRPVLRALVGQQLAAVRRQRGELHVLQRQLERVQQRLATRAPAARDGACRCLER